MGEIDGLCGCKGIRTCLVCETETRTTRNCNSANVQLDLYCYCGSCSRAWPTTNFPAVPRTLLSSSCDGHSASSVEFPGVTLIPDFVSMEEEAEVVQLIDTSPWKPSQSGRMKQDYGPKVNFKRRKIRKSGFTGLPVFIKPFVDRMNASCGGLADFVPIEQCNLDYDPSRGSSIDPHVDDSWLWGERLVTINLLSGTYLDMTPTQTTKADSRQTLVRIPLPPRSLLVLSGPARHCWNHGIQRGAVGSRRIAVTLRELTGEFLMGGAEEEIGREVMDIARTYAGTIVS